MEVKHHRSEEALALTLTLTETAKAHLLKNVFSQKGKIGVRFSIKKTGCSGLSYVVEYVDFVGDGDMILPLADKLLVCVDRQSAPFINGSVVDYIREGLNAKLVFNNPNQKGQCGCGESFIV
ncbi:MAG: iron-sulfur cluster assembly accessory protein [Gammaproteobacteria bacterium]|nr:iron-sulfur cluster assembly accessory protein [Gammaproteobacteria bacterium]